MTASTPSDSEQSADLLVDIVETLEAHGLPDDSYQLHDTIDVEALGTLLASADDAVEVRFTVEGIRLAVSQDDVEVVDDDRAGSLTR